MTGNNAPLLQTIQDGSGTMDLGGSIVRQVEEDHNVNMSASHITNIGRMIEVSRLNSFL